MHYFYLLFLYYFLLTRVQKPSVQVEEAVMEDIMEEDIMEDIMEGITEDILIVTEMEVEVEAIGDHGAGGLLNGGHGIHSIVIALLTLVLYDIEFK